MGIDITSRIVGKRVAAVLSNGHVLQIRTQCGAELEIAWLDDNGLPVKGRPVIAGSGARLLARGVRDLIHLPGVAAAGR